MVLGGMLGEIGDMTGHDMPSSLGVPARAPFLFAMPTWVGFRPVVPVVRCSLTWEAEEEELGGRGMFSGARGGVDSLSGGGISVPSVREPKPPTERAGSSNFEGAGVRFLVDIVTLKPCSRLGRP